MQFNKEFWKGKKVLLTGHTGFKGAWLALLLERLGAQVSGYALAPNTNPSLYTLAQVSKSLAAEKIADLADRKTLEKFVHEANPEIVFHLAAQPLVAESYRNPIETFMTNTMGTAHLLEACRGLTGLKNIVVVTSDKCYLNEGGGSAFRETDPLGGADPYSASKATAEIVTKSYAQSFFMKQNVMVHTVRAGNIVGGGDWADNRLIPDVIRTVYQQEQLIIRMPQATRPWQHVLDALAGYLLVGERLKPTEKSEAFESWNFGPVYSDYMTVGDMLTQAKKSFPNLSWSLQPTVEFKEASLLALDSSRARRLLGWNPKLDIHETVRRTFAWYSLNYQGLDAKQICQSEIDEVYELSH